MVSDLTDFQIEALHWCKISYKKTFDQSHSLDLNILNKKSVFQPLGALTPN